MCQHGCAILRDRVAASLKTLEACTTPPLDDMRTQHKVQLSKPKEAKTVRKFWMSHFVVKMFMDKLVKDNTHL